jgi:hypothetical protein
VVLRKRPAANDPKNTIRSRISGEEGGIAAAREKFANRRSL